MQEQSDDHFSADHFFKLYSCGRHFTCNIIADSMMEKPSRSVRVFLCILTLLSACSHAPVQIKRPPALTQGSEYVLRAAVLSEKAYFEGANFHLRKAIAEFKKIGDWENIIRCYIRIGANFQAMQQYKQAEESYNEALKLALSRSQRQSLELASEFRQLGIKYFTTKNYSQALAMFEKARVIHASMLGPDHPELLKDFNYLALIYWNMGDRQQAITHYNRSLSIKLRQAQTPHSEIIKSFGFYSDGEAPKLEFSDGKKFYSRSLELYRETYGDAHPLLATIHEDIGILNALEGSYSEALTHLRSSLDIRLSFFGEESQEAASSYKNIGICLLLENEGNEALEYLNRALVCQRDAPPADIHFQIGRAHAVMGDPRGALRFFQLALKELVPGFYSNDVAANPPLTRFNSSNSLLEVLAEKGGALIACGNTDSGGSSELQAALSTFSLAIELTDRLRTDIQAEEYRLLFGSKVQHLYDQAISVALKLHAGSGDSQFKEKAFTFSEMSKAALLSEAFNESQARTFAGIPGELLQKERDVRERLAIYDIQLEQERQKKQSTPAQIEELENRYFEQEAAYQELIDHFEQSYPKYYELKYRTKLTAIAELQQELPPHGALIEYFVGREQLTTFVLRRDRLEITTQPKAEDFEQKVVAFYEAIKKIEEQNYRLLGTELYARLVAPIRPQLTGVKKLVIIPHGVLHFLPFEALVDDAAADAPFPALRFLVREYAVSYHYSGHLWRIGLRRGPAADAMPAVADMSLAGFAPVFGNPQTASDLIGVTNLPASEGELRSLLDLFSARGRRAKGYFYQEASEDNFKSAAMKDYSIIHVATHGFSDQQNPKLSGLVFFPPLSTEAANDGVLYAGETYNLDLRAELIVLSSCESGIGKLIEGEGMVALSRGFFYAGARNLIFSLWKVEDRSTSRLMVELYKNILAGQAFDRALQKAKLALLADPVSAFPCYWGGFILLGK